MEAASRDGAMSQRNASAVEETSGGEAAATAAKAAGVRLVPLTDEKGVEIVAAGGRPIAVLA